MADRFEGLLSLLGDDVSVRWLITLLHFVWQGAVVGGVVAIAGKLLRGASARPRYALYSAALLILPVCVAVTFCAVDVPASLQSSSHLASPADLPANSSALPSQAPAPAAAVRMETAEAPDAPAFSERVVTNAATVKAVADDNSESLSRSSLAMLSRSAPWIAVAYVVGAACFLLRLSTALWGAHRLRTPTARVTDEKLLKLIADQADRLKLKCVPVVAYCERVAVPTVVGVLRPMVLLPVSLMAGLTLDDLAAIVRHELAHVHRCDLWMNLLQRVIESLLFFHPAVWFISRRLSAERELCCDDLVVSSGHEPMHYAGALLRMAELCAISRQPGALALAATGDRAPLLERRIERLMNWGNTPRLQLTRAGMAGLLIALVSLIVVPGIAHTWAQAQAREVVQPDDPLPAGSALRFGTSRFRLGIAVSNMAVSADGKIAVAANGSHMGTTRVFDLASGRVLYSMGPGIEAAAISPDGRTIVTKQDFSLRIRDAATGKELRGIGLQRANPYSRNEWVAFTPDGKAIAVTSQGKVIHLIDFASGRKIRDFSNDNPESSLSKPFSTVLGIAFSQDGKLMASGGFANDQGTYFARLWEVKTGREIRRFMHSRRSYGIRSLAFSPDAKTLATRSHDGRLRLFDVATGKERKTFPKDGGGRRAGTVAFAPDGKTVAAAGDSIRLYDVATGDERLRIDRRQASHLQFTDGGKTLTGAFMGAIYRWDTATGKSLTPEAGDSVVEQILVTPHGSLVVTRGQRGDVHIWDGTNGTHLRRIKDTVWQRDLAMSPDGRFLVWPVEDRSIHFVDPVNPRVGHYGSRIRLYAIAANRYVDRFPGFKGDAGDLAFTKDGKKLITVDHLDGMVRLWNFETGKQERSFRAVPDAEINQYRQVSHTALSPDGKTLAVAYHPEDSRMGWDPRRLGRLTSRPRPVRLWDVATGKQRHELKSAHGDMAFSPDGRLFVTASRIVWETATGNRVAALPDGPDIRALAFSRDGRFLATAVSGDVIKVWKVATWTKQAEFKGHRDRLTTLTFTPEGQLLSGSVDTTVLAWDLGRRSVSR